MAYLYLVIAIVCEVTATTALKASDGFTKLGPSLIVAVGYGLSLLFLSLTLRTIPVGIAYAIWAGAGTAFIVLTGAMFLGQSLDTPAIVGVSLIVLGVVVVNGFSGSVVH
jgi:small multidrug resistance pump